MNDIAAIDHYIDHVLPGLMTPEEVELLARHELPVAIQVGATGSMAREWKFLARREGLRRLEGDAPVECSFRMAPDIFLGLVCGRLSAPGQFLLRRITIQGNVLQALKVASLLDGIFRRAPWRPGDAAAPIAAPAPGALSAHQQAILALHLDPSRGAPYWIERARHLGVRADRLEQLDDLAAFGPMDREALASRPFRNFLPAGLAKEPLFVGETGGTTGRPAASVWSESDFHRAFLAPLLAALPANGVSGLRAWLFVGPTGPHPIGRAARALASATTGVEAFTIDFDPRWHRKLPPDSLSAKRHLLHIIDQAAWLLERERPDALFITPSVLTGLMEAGHGGLLAQVRLVHFGGQSLSPEEDRSLRAQLPASAFVLNGYGNSLFGCILEDINAGPLHYPFPEDRLVVRLLRDDSLVHDVGEGGWGRVLFHRFDESMLLLNVLERDEARREGRHFVSPRPIPAARALAEGGIY